MLFHLAGLGFPICGFAGYLFVYVIRWPSLIPPGQPFEFVPLDWLKKWLDDSTATKEINNSLFLCSHGKLHPDKVGEAKRISLQAAQILYDRYGGGPRLDGKSCASRVLRSLIIAFLFLFLVHYTSILLCYLACTHAPVTTKQLSPSDHQT